MSPYNQVDRDAWAADRRGDGWHYKDIAEGLGISISAAHDAVERAYHRTLNAPAERARAVQRARLERIHEAAMEVLERKHITVSHGRIIAGEDSEPLLDDGPVLQAVDRLLRISESLRKLEGLDAPSRVSIDAEHLGQEVAELLNALTQTATDDSPTG
jgi:hypothetical protein